LPVIAEDLGVVTPDVAGLLDKYGLPGMRVLQFGFAGLSEDFLPHHYVRECVAYTGTHDNDTSRGWFSSATRAEQQFALQYLRSTEERVVDDMIRANWSHTP
jgi:4-alpha-glucanotransferase